MINLGSGGRGIKVRNTNVTSHVQLLLYGGRAWE